MSVAYWIYLVVLVFAPLAFGTTELWSLVTVEVLVGVAAVVMFVTLWLKRDHLYEVPGLWPLLLLLVFMVIQLVPLPGGLVKLIAPGSYEAYAPLVAVSGEQWIPLTINQKLTLQELLRIGSYALMYIMSVQLLSTYVRLKRTLTSIIWLSATIAVMAIIHHVSSPETLFWIRSGPEGTTSFGPWVNQNQYAGFMEMLSPLAIALFLFYKPRLDSGESIRGKIVSFFTMPGGNLHLLYGLAAVVITMSVFVSLCRGGILTVSVAILVFMLLYHLKRPQQGRWAVVGIVCCILVTVSWFGWGTIVAEFNRGVDASGSLQDSRFTLWKDTLQLIENFAIFGGGFGTFVDSYPSYSTIPSDYLFDHAHNDYLELLTDGGIIGFGLAAWFVMAVLRHGWSKVRARRDQYASLLGIGAFTGIVAMLLHSITDFNMHNGADGLYFFFLCGLLVAAANIRFSTYAAPTLLKARNTRCNPAYVAVVVLFVVMASVVQYRTVVAEAAYHSVRSIYLSINLNENSRQDLEAGLSRAEQLDPLERRYSYKLALLDRYRGDGKSARQGFLHSVRKGPMDGEALQWLGLLAEDETTSKRLVEMGYKRGFDKDQLALTYAEYLVSKGDRDRAISVIAARVGQKAELVRSWSPMLVNLALKKEEILALLPETPEAWIVYGDYLQQTGDLAGAEFYRSSALSFIGSEEKPRPHWFQQLIQFYILTGNKEKALSVLREAAERIPDHASFHVQLADHYRTENLTFLAREEYERALMIEPGNGGARKGLRKMGMLDAY